MQLLGTLLECFVTGLFAAMWIIIYDTFLAPAQPQDKE